MEAVGQYPTSAGRIWAGRILTVLPALFLLLDGVMKLIRPAVVVNATVELGYPANVILPLGIVLTGSTILFLIPRTSVLGAILLTGYLGGAVATHVRVGAGVFPIVFPIVFGILLWGGLYFRDDRVSSILPWRQRDIHH